MAKFQQYISQQAPQGNIASAGGAQIAEFHGIERIGEQLAQQQRELQAKQDAERKRVEHNEAVTYSVNAGSEADIQWRERLQKEQDEGNSDGMTVRILSDFDEYRAEKIEQAPEAARDFVSRELANARSQIHARAFLYETKARDKKTEDDFRAGLADDRRTAFADPSQFQPILARRLALVSALELPAQVKQQLAQESRGQLALEAAASLTERDPDGFLQRAGMAGAKTGKDGKPLPTDPEAAAERVKSDPILSNLAPDDMRQMVNRATLLKVQRDNAIAAERDRLERKAEIEATRREREANQAYTILSDWAREGITADPVAAKPLLDKIAGTAYQGAYQQVAQTVAQRASAAMQPLPVQQQRLTSLYAQRAQSGTSPSLEHEIQQSEQVLAATKRDYEDDALTGGVKRGLVQITPISADAPIPQLVQQLQARLPAAAQMSIAAGRSVSPMTSDEAAKFKQRLDALPPKERSSTIASMAAALGPQASTGLAAQLDKQDRGMALAFASAADMTTSGRFTSELILKGQQAKKEGTSTKGDKAPEVKAAKWQADISAYLGDAFGSQKTTNDVRDAAVLIAHGIAAEQGGALSSDDLERAARLAVGGSLIDHNGRRLPLPAGVDQDALDKRLRSVKAADIQAPGGKVRAAGVEMSVDAFLTALPGQQLMPVGRGRYTPLVQGRPVTDAAGNPIIIQVQ